jgi:hypothetical protein
VEIPYGFRNRFPADDEGARPSAFGPGNHAYEFSVDFAADESLAWRLWPRSGPLTTVTANASSVRCDPESVELLCANSCTASLTAECADPVVTRGQCMNDCALNASFFNDFGCGAEWNAFLACSATVPPAEENWDCSFPGFPPSPMPPNCDAELMEAFICAGF